MDRDRCRELPISLCRTHARCNPQNSKMTMWSNLKIVKLRWSKKKRFTHNIVLTDKFYCFTTVWTVCTSSRSYSDHSLICWMTNGHQQIRPPVCFLSASIINPCGASQAYRAWAIIGRDQWESTLPSLVSYYTRAYRTHLGRESAQAMFKQAARRCQAERADRNALP